MKFIFLQFFVLIGVFASNAFAQEILNKSRESIHFSQYVEPGVEQRLVDTGSNEQSRVFFRKINGADLNRGAELMIDAKQAIIQVSPLDRVDKGRRITNNGIPQGMTLSNGSERRRVDDDSIALHRKSQGLRQNFPALYGRAHVMRVPEDMGRGRFTLKTNGNARPDDEYIVYVLDKHSDIALDMQTPSKRFSRTGRLTLNARPGGNTSAKLDSVSASLIAPNGKRYPVMGQLRGNAYSADWPIQVDAPSVPGELWSIEVHSTLKNQRNELVERVAVTAVDIYSETAAVSTIDGNPKGLTLSLNVNDAGRYEARALVFGRDGNGDYQPAMLAYQAGWFEAGQREMMLPIDNIKLKTTGLVGPYQVRNVQFLDQGRMSVLDYLQGSWTLR
ncbi:DUF4785 domain-containing protein [Microbulbifer aggregans]|uniref:DUF4785 domain-containing protein n=1 Tax=Microbulbifer aggregans TaxID=1769779 RepID=UPI001CFE3BF8|nr:DUF4785 domain-containing protein [Microbulbifer aggregans]